MASTPPKAESTSSSAAHSRQGSGEAPQTVTMSDKNPDDTSKLRTFLSILKKFIGVTDMASVRFSLPAQLMEPIPNLEYWQYCDRPETFASIPDSDDALGRLLGALRFWFTKDLKYVKGRPCKPYNSVLGEFFRCNWDVEQTLPALVGKTPSPTAASDKQAPIRVTFLCEQTSHHPPVSAYHYECPEKGVSARGFDQLLAKFTGTRVRVGPGNFNEGIFIKLDKLGESYHLTHPVAHLGGLLTGSLNISVSDVCFVTCPQTRLKAILQYLEEGWIGKAQNKMIGVIYKYDPENDNKTKIKEVPDSDVVARLEGCWWEKIYFTLGPKPFDKNPDKILISDLSPLTPQPKVVPPVEEQLPNESRKYWEKVTKGILSKQWNDATNAKIEIEDRQRAKAAERKAQGIEWHPRFFKEALGPAGQPELSEEGREAIVKMQNQDWKLTPSEYLAA